MPLLFFLFLFFILVVFVFRFPACFGGCSRSVSFFLSFFLSFNLPSFLSTFHSCKTPTLTPLPSSFFILIHRTLHQALKGQITTLEQQLASASVPPASADELRSATNEVKRLQTLLNHANAQRKTCAAVWVWWFL